jgi:hypothetical protein
VQPEGLNITPGLIAVSETNLISLIRNSIYYLFYVKVRFALPRYPDGPQLVRRYVTDEEQTALCLFILDINNYGWN